jgi:ribosomal protein L24E
MKTLAYILLLLPLLFSCRREKDQASEEQAELAADNDMITRETDQALDDANDVLTTSRYGDGTSSSPCGITVDSSEIGTGKIILNFDGSTCFFGTRKREGEIIVQFSPNGGKWSDAGAKITLAFVNYKVTRVSDGKSIVLNGYKSIVNSSGGLIRQLTALSDPVEHSIRANVSIEFEDGTNRSWRVARKRSVSKSGGYYQVQLNGDTSVSGYKLVTAWGTTRRGSVFYITTEAPTTFTSQCFRKIKSGELKVYTIYRTFAITFGVDADGNPDQDTCPYGYKVEWTNSKNKEERKVVEYR